MNTTRFDLLSLLFTGLALLGLPRLLRGWRALVAPEPSEEGRALAVYVAVFLAVPLATLAHELGHLVVAMGLGAKDATLHYRVFWGFVDYSTALPGHGNWGVALAGNAVSWALAALALGVVSTCCPSANAPGAERGAPIAVPSLDLPSPDAQARDAVAAEGPSESAGPAPSTDQPLPGGDAIPEPPPKEAQANRGRSLPPGVSYALRTFGVLEMVHTLVIYPLMSLGDLPGADWTVIYGRPFWAGTWIVAAVHAASLLWLRRALRAEW
jgi:hypothetical protein